MQCSFMTTVPSALFTGLKSPIQWPSVLLCRSPIDKDKKAIEFQRNMSTNEFANEEEFLESEKEVYYKDPKEYISSVIMFSTVGYPTVDQINEIPIRAPYVSTYLVDYQYFGYCAEISGQAIRNYFIGKGVFSSDKIDENYFMAVFIKV